MKTRKYILFEQPGRTLVLDPEDIVQKVDLSLENVYILHVSVEEAEKLLPPGLSPSEVEDILTEKGIDFRPAGDSVCINAGTLYFCGDGGGVADAEDCISVPVYQYWDGANWREIWLEEVDLTEVVVEEDSSESLDRWDGQNWSFGGRFAHADLHKVVSIDGESVHEEKYLLTTWTQWQGDIPHGRIVSAEEAEKLRGEEGEKFLRDLIE